jgi:hypothetical protein
MPRLTVTRPSLARLAVVAASAAAALASLPAPDAAAQETVCKGRAVTIMGTAGHDRINGTAGNDVISTGPGDDLVNAGGGNDYVCTGEGDDRIDGGAGADVFSAGAGNDACSDASDTRIGCEPGMATTFMPSRHGFPFVNHYAGIPTIATPFGTVNGVDYGLCGGMAFAARDHWILDKNAPGNATTPQSGVVFDYMWRRLVDSLTIDFSSNLFRFNDLQQKTTTALNASNVTETVLIKSALASGPVPVGLIIPSATGPIWANHQVLAIGWFVDPATGNTVVKLYDPNHPDEMTYLDTTAKTLRAASAANGSPIRGWFKEKVDFKAPTY